MSRIPRIPAKTPSRDVSLVIPVRNEGAHIERCLDSVLAQDTSGSSVEILMVDGLSEDGTREAIRRRMAVDPRLRLLDNPALRVSPALNAGLLVSSGRVVIRMDAHSEYAADYVATTMAVLAETGCDAAGGVQVPAPGGPGPVAQGIAAIQEGAFGTGGAPHRREGYEGPASTLWLGGFRREVAERVGGFDEDLFRSEDNDFYQRVRAGGGRLWVSARIRARYLCRPTLSSYARQCYVTGTEIAPTLRANPKALSLRHVAPALALLVAVGLVAVGIGAPGARRPAAAMLAVAVGLYSLGVVVTAVRAGVRHGASVFLPAAAAVVTAHGTYALGTLVGLAKAVLPGARDRD